MEKTVYLSEHGDDRNDGLTDTTPVRPGAKAVKVSITVGAQNFHLDSSALASAGALFV